MLILSQFAGPYLAQPQRTTQAVPAQPQQPQRYAVVCLHTGQRQGKPYATRKRARARADALDLRYGAYRYTVVAV